jgi:hypothetical protein
MITVTEEQVERLRLLALEAEEVYKDIDNAAKWGNQKARKLQHKAAVRCVRRRDAWLKLFDRWINLK